jgi:hypothetical protein
MGGFIDLCNLISEIIVGCTEDDKTKPYVNTEEPIILTAAKLRELRWMTVPQLAAIYHYGKVKVKIQDTEAAYRELRFLNAQQFKAIFGNEEN